MYGLPRQQLHKIVKNLARGNISANAAADARLIQY